MTKLPLETTTRVVKSNLLQKDVFLRDISLPKNVQTKYSNQQYFELHRKPLENGIGFQEVLTPVDYPITPESVKSHASSVDYKSDPVGAIASAPKRKNLGDITSMQEVLALDNAAALELCQNLINKLKESQTSTETSTETPTEPPTETSTETPINGGNQ